MTKNVRLRAVIKHEHERKAFWWIPEFVFVELFKGLINMLKQMTAKPKVVENVVESHRISRTQKSTNPELIKDESILHFPLW